LIADLRAIEPYHKERLKPDYFQHLVDRLKEDPPDVIYMVSYLKDGALLVKTIRESKLNSLLVGGAGGFTSHKNCSIRGHENITINIRKNTPPRLTIMAPKLIQPYW
jgi:hypothetical protein